MLALHHDDKFPEVISSERGEFVVPEISLSPIALGLSFQQCDMEEEWWRRGLVTLRQLGRSGGGSGLELME